MLTNLYKIIPKSSFSCISLVAGTNFIDKTLDKYAYTAGVNKICEKYEKYHQYPTLNFLVSPTALLPPRYLRGDLLIKCKLTKKSKLSRFHSSFVTNEIFIEDTYDLFDKKTCKQFNLKIDYNYLQSALNFNSYLGVEMALANKLSLRDNLLVVNMNTVSVTLLDYIISKGYFIRNIDSYNAIFSNRIDIIRYLHNNNLLIKKYDILLWKDNVTNDILNYLRSLGYEVLI